MKFRKIAAATAAFVVALTAVTYSAPEAEVHAASLSNLQTEKQKLQAEINQVTKELKEAKNDLAKEAQYQASLSQQIKLNLQKVEVMSQELTILGEELDQKELELEETSQELDQKEQEIDSTYEQYKQRMRVMYMAGETSTLEMLFAADSFADFLTNIEMMKAITAHDTELLDTLEVQVEMDSNFFSDTVRGIEEQERKIAKQLDYVLGISAKVTLVEPKSLARSEGKAVRVIDKRKLHD